jgi:hypothetical protein
MQSAGGYVVAHASTKGTPRARAAVSPVAMTPHALPPGLAGRLGPPIITWDLLSISNTPWTPQPSIRLNNLSLLAVRDNGFGTSAEMNAGGVASVRFGPENTTQAYTVTCQLQLHSGGAAVHVNLNTFNPDENTTDVSLIDQDLPLAAGAQTVALTYQPVQPKPQFLEFAISSVQAWQFWGCQAYRTLL